MSARWEHPCDGCLVNAMSFSEQIAFTNQCIFQECQPNMLFTISHYVREEGDGACRRMRWGYGEDREKHW